MIHYQLRCACGHEFDGWFQSSAGFEAQSARQLIACPACAGAEVSRALMAPGIAAGAEPAAPPVPVPAPARKRAVAGGGMPDAVRAALTRLRAEVEARCDYVGPDFAAEARRIHNGETMPRGIYGESTDGEAEALADDGIDVARIPWLPPADG